MNIIRFTSTFKPDGTDYIKVTLWNRYIHNKTILFTLFLPTAGALYFLVTNPGPFWWVFILIMFYPVYAVLGFTYQIKKHLKFRSPADTAKTEYTFMNNGILADRAELQTLDLIHWEDVDTLWELKDYFLLYYKGRLVLVLSKKDMEEGQPDAVRGFILKRIKQNYKKSRLF